MVGGWAGGTEHEFTLASLAARCAVVVPSSGRGGPTHGKNGPDVDGERVPVPARRGVRGAERVALGGAGDAAVAAAAWGGVRGRAGAGARGGGLAAGVLRGAGPVGGAGGSGAG